MDQYLYIFDKTGSGDVHRMLLRVEDGEMIYNKLKTEKWKATTNLTNFETVVLNNVLFIIGGFDKRTAKPLGRLLSFDPWEYKWRERQPMPTTRMKCAAVVKDNRIYVVGGEKANGMPSSRTEIYNPFSDQWEKGGSLPSPRLQPSIVAIEGGSLFCAGGSRKGIIRKNIWMYTDNQWRELKHQSPETLPNALDKSIMVTLDKNIYFIGGITSKVDENGKTFMHTNPQMFVMQPTVPADQSNQKCKEHINKWDKLPSPPDFPRYNAGHFIIGSKFYLLGGSNMETGERVTPVESYNPRTDEWETEFRIVKETISNVSCVILTETKDFKMRSIRSESPSSQVPSQYVLW